MKFISLKDYYKNKNSSNNGATPRRNRDEPYSTSSRPLNRVLHAVRCAVRGALDPAPAVDDLSALMSGMDLASTQMPPHIPATSEDAASEEAQNAQATQENAIGNLESLPVEVLEDSDRLKFSRALILDEFCKVGMNLNQREPEEKSLLSGTDPCNRSSKEESFAGLCKTWKGVAPYETSPKPEDFMKVFYLTYLQPMIPQRAEYIAQSYRQSELDAFSHQNSFPPQNYTVFSAPHISTQSTPEDDQDQLTHRQLLLELFGDDPGEEVPEVEEDSQPTGQYDETTDWAQSPVDLTDNTPTEPNSPELSYQALDPQPSASGQTSSFHSLSRSPALYSRQSAPGVAGDYGACGEDDWPGASSQAASEQATVPSSPVASPSHAELPQNGMQYQYMNGYAPFDSSTQPDTYSRYASEQETKDEDTSMMESEPAPVRTHEELVAAASRLAQPSNHWQESQQYYAPFHSIHDDQEDTTMFAHSDPSYSADGMDTEADASLGEAAYRVRDDPSAPQEMNSGYNHTGVQITTSDAPQPTDPRVTSSPWVQTNTDAQQPQHLYATEEATEEQPQETRLRHALRGYYNTDEARTDLLMSFWSAVWQPEAEDQQNYEHLENWIDALRQWSGGCEQQFWDLLTLFLHKAQFATDARHTWDLVSQHMNTLQTGATEELGVWGLLSVWFSLCTIASNEQETWRLLECWVELWQQTRDAAQTYNLLILRLEGLQQQQQVASNEIDISILYSTGVQIHNDAPQTQTQPYAPHPLPESESIDQPPQHDQEQQHEERECDYQQSAEYLQNVWQDDIQAEADQVAEEQQQSEIQPADAPSEPPTDPSVAAHDVASNSWESVLAASQEAPAPASASATSPPDLTSVSSSTPTAQTQASGPSSSDNVPVPRETLEKLFDAVVETVGDANLSHASHSASPIRHGSSDQDLLESLEMAPIVLRQQQQASSSSEQKRKRSQDHKEHSEGDSSSSEERPKKGKRTKRSHREDSNDDSSSSSPSERASRPSKRRRSDDSNEESKKKRSKRRHDDSNHHVPSSDLPERRQRSEIQREEAATSSPSSSSAPTAQIRAVAPPLSILRRRPRPPPSFPGALYDRSVIFPAPALPPTRRAHVRFVGDVDVAEHAQTRPIIPVTRNTAGALAERRERLAAKSQRRTCSRTLAAIGRYFGFA